MLARAGAELRKQRNPWVCDTGLAAGWRGALPSSCRSLSPEGQSLQAAPVTNGPRREAVASTPSPSRGAAELGRKPGASVCTRGLASCYTSGKKSTVVRASPEGVRAAVRSCPPDASC